MKIYTRTGDDGSTGLFGGPRVEKDDSRIEAYGAVDELNATLGLSRANLAASTLEAEICAEMDEVLERIQHDLFAIGAELATPDPVAKGVQWIVVDDVQRLEGWIDLYESHLPPLQSFVLPSGSELASRLHVARTTCRRAERRTWTLFKEQNAELSPALFRYLNRLSDLLFVLSRYSNHRQGRGDSPWRSPAEGEL